MCGNCRVSEEFCDMTFEFNLTQLVTCSTHTHGNILDLILINNEDLIKNVSVNASDHSQIPSDHFPISIEIDLNCQPFKNATAVHAYDYSKVDYTSMNDFIII